MRLPSGSRRCASDTKGDRPRRIVARSAGHPEAVRLAERLAKPARRAVAAGDRLATHTGPSGAAPLPGSVAVDWPVLEESPNFDRTTSSGYQSLVSVAFRITGFVLLLGSAFSTRGMAVESTAPAGSPAAAVSDAAKKPVIAGTSGSRRSVNASKKGTAGATRSGASGESEALGSAGNEASSSIGRARTPKSAVAPSPSELARTVASNDVKSSKSTSSSRTTSANGGSASSKRDSKKESSQSGQESPSDTTSDPELSALNKAEKALFPWALRGVRSNFSFDETPLGFDPRLGTSKPEFPAWIRELRLPSIFPNVDGRILTYLDFYRTTPEGRSILRSWARKRGRYESAIVATLAKSGVPTDLVWQSLVESGHNPTIRSPAGAAGLWQFMPDTARACGLVVDRWTDERLDPERSTVAAAKWMADLFQRFGNWELALAAYNMGEAGLLRAIRKYNTNDFWSLCRYEAGLPMETALYVPRIIALTIAMQNPGAFGIDAVEPDDPIEFETVNVLPGQLLSSVSRAIGVDEEELNRINPQLLARRTPPSVTSDKAVARIYVPRGTADVLRHRMGRLNGLEPDLVAYTVRSADSLERIANARGVTVDALCTLNRMTADERVEVGTVLLVPRQSSEPSDSKNLDEERVAVVPPDLTVPTGQRRIFYRVRSGDTLSSIATAFGVSRADLLANNSIDPSARLQPRMLVQIIVPSGTKSARLPFLEESDVTVLVAGSIEFIEYFEGLRGNERIVVQAKAKDTLASIGAKYGVSVGSMERINRRSRRDALVAGEDIVVYTKRGGNRARVAATR